MAAERKSNRLIHEKSPYLLQHAHNPVDWFPWGNEAFDKAKKENKPVFVSIGYSTCHWCHVMERESFEDPKVAELLNQNFVSVKVDREERPDVDSVYMNVCQMLTGQGGWPLNVFLTPDQEPFYAGTYFPKDSLYGRPGMLDILPQLHEKYKKEPGQVASIAKKITAALKERSESGLSRIDLQAIPHKAFKQISSQFDTVYGGFGSAPKFPMAHQLLFLMSYHSWTGNELAHAMVERTLHSMANGGIYDHIGGGFARYSTDAAWLVPHFEKMLYDNALILYTLADAFQISKEPRWKQLAVEIAGFVEREMTHRNGGFYSALDADSEGVEGKYYVWSHTEVLNILGQRDGELFAHLYDITKGGNFEGSNIPNQIHVNTEQIAREAGMKEKELKEFTARCRKELLEARKQRSYPHLDDKILTGWNALMIAALAKAGKVFGEPGLLKAARKAAQFIEETLIKDGQLFARYREEEVKYEAYLDDYAYLLWAYIELFQAEGDTEDLKKADDISTRMLSLFWDDHHGGFYFTSNSSEKLILREKQLFDHALPSGNSVAAFQLWRLGKLTGKTELITKAEEAIHAFGEDIESYPSGPVYMLQAMMAIVTGGSELVVSGINADRRNECVEHFYSLHRPFDVMVNADPKQPSYPLWEDKTAADTDFILYKCRNYSCLNPIRSLTDAITHI